MGEHVLSCSEYLMMEQPVLCVLVIMCMLFQFTVNGSGGGEMEVCSEVVCWISLSLSLPLSLPLCLPLSLSFALSLSLGPCLILCISSCSDGAQAPWNPT